VNVNDELAELKSRLRRMEEALATAGGPGIADRVPLAQAVSRARRLARREDRTRPPSAEFRASVEEAELLAHAVRRA
jgi:hypothetical protein